MANDPVRGFNAASIIEKESDKGGSLAALVASVETLLEDRLSKTLTRQKSEAPDVYRRSVTENNNIALSVVFAGLENGSPAFYARAFFSGDELTVVRQDHPQGEFTV